MIPAESGAEHAVFRRNGGGDEYAADRKAVGHAFRHGDEVCPDAGMLVGEELSGPAVSGLDFVQDQQGARPVAESAEPLQEGVGRFIDAGHTLDAFDEDGGIHLCLKGL